jgi:hypothetical protein
MGLDTLVLTDRLHFDERHTGMKVFSCHRQNTGQCQHAAGGTGCALLYSREVAGQTASVYAAGCASTEARQVARQQRRRLGWQDNAE